MINQTINTYKNAYSGLSKSTWLLSTVMLINRSGTMVVPFLSLYLVKEMGYSIGTAGFVTGLFGAGAFVGAYFGGRLTDRIGFYPVQLITLIGGGVFFIVLGLAKTFPAICACTFIVAFVNEAFRPANSTAIAFYSKEETRTRSYALNRLAVNLGWAAGSFTGGILFDLNYKWLFWVDGITNIAAAGLMWYWLKPVDYKTHQKQHQHATSYTSAYKDKEFIWFVALTCLFAACFFQLFTNLSVYYEVVLHFSGSYIGMLMATNGILIALVEMVLVYKLEGKRQNSVYIISGVLLVAVAYAMLNIFSIEHFMAFVMIIVITFGEILAMPFMNTYWISRSNASNRGQYAALYTMAWSGAQSLGPVGGAQVAEHAGFYWLWWILVGLLLLSAIGFRTLHYKKNGRNPIITEVATRELIEEES